VIISLLVRRSIYVNLISLWDNYVFREKKSRGNLFVVHGENNFAEISKNLVTSENHFIGS